MRFQVAHFVAPARSADDSVTLGFFCAAQRQAESVRSVGGSAAKRGQALCAVQISCKGREFGFPPLPLSLADAQPAPPPPRPRARQAASPPPAAAWVSANVVLTQVRQTQRPVATSTRRGLRQYRRYCETRPQRMRRTAGRPRRRPRAVGDNRSATTGSCGEREARGGAACWRQELASLANADSAAPSIRRRLSPRHRLRGRHRRRCRASNMRPQQARHANV